VGSDLPKGSEPLVLVNNRVLQSTYHNMTSDLTIDTLAFKLVYSDKDGSLRREISRGVNLPEELSIKHQPYTDSATKLPGTRSVVRIDRFLDVDGEGKIAPVSAYMVVTVPQQVGVVSADVLAVVQRLITVLQEDDSGLDLMDEIFVSREQ